MDSVKATVADAAVKTVDTLTSKPDETKLDPPKDTPFTKAELSKYNGSDPNMPIYVAIKGKIYDGESPFSFPPRLLHFAEIDPLIRLCVCVQYRRRETCTDLDVVTTFSRGKTLQSKIAPLSLFALDFALLSRSR
jgi:hypothetical protein